MNGVQIQHVTLFSFVFLDLTLKTHHNALPTDSSRQRWVILASFPETNSNRSQGSKFTKTVRHDTYPEIDPVTKSDHSKHYVLITGASKGLGRVIATSFAKAGAAGIAIGARSDLGAVEKDIISAASAAGKKAPRVLKLKLDVTSWEDIVKAAEDTEKEFGRLDILINNAGYLSSWIPIVEDDRDEHWKNYELNVRGTYWMCKAFLPLMLKGGEKTIVNLTSAGAHGIHYGASGYQTSKFALLRFTEYTMAEYGDQGLLAYCVHPGGVPSDMVRKFPDHSTSPFADFASFNVHFECPGTLEAFENVIENHEASVYSLIEVC